MKKDNTILLLLAGFAVYWFYFRKKTGLANVVAIPSGEITNVPPATPYTPLVGDVMMADGTSVAPTAEYKAHFALSGMKKLGKVPNTI
jgi:hypothetical protein